MRLCTIWIFLLILSVIGIGGDKCLMMKPLILIYSSRGWLIKTPIPEHIFTEGFRGGLKLSITGPFILSTCLGRPQTL